MKGTLQTSHFLSTPTLQRERQVCPPLIIRRKISLLWRTEHYHLLPKRKEHRPPLRTEHYRRLLPRWRIEHGCPVLSEKLEVIRRHSAATCLSLSQRGTLGPEVVTVLTEIGPGVKAAKEIGSRLKGTREIATVLKGTGLGMKKTKEIGSILPRIGKVHLGLTEIESLLSKAGAAQPLVVRTLLACPHRPADAAPHLATLRAETEDAQTAVPVLTLAASSLRHDPTRALGREGVPPGLHGWRGTTRSPGGKRCSASTGRVSGPRAYPSVCDSHGHGCV